jgi:copper resistance protein C
MHRTLLATATAAWLASGPALAHAFLKSSTPSVGSALATPPAEVSISFTEDVELSFSKVAVLDSAGGDVTSGKVRAVAADRLAVTLKKLPAGSYTVTWHATSVDAHRTQGKFTFSVKQ